MRRSDLVKFTWPGVVKASSLNFLSVSLMHMSTRRTETNLKSVQAGVPMKGLNEKYILIKNKLRYYMIFMILDHRMNIIRHGMAPHVERMKMQGGTWRWTKHG